LFVFWTAIIGEDALQNKASESLIRDIAARRRYNRATAGQEGMPLAAR
jgi:hypothetical protein